MLWCNYIDMASEVDNFEKKKKKRVGDNSDVWIPLESWVSYDHHIPTL